VDRVCIVIGNKLEQEIISLYTKDISSLYSINQIAGKLGKKYPYINKKVTLLIKNQIFKKTISGRSYLCSLNLNNEETIYLLILNEIRKKKAELKINPSLEKLIQYIKKIKILLLLDLVMKVNNKLIFVFDKEEDKQQFKKRALLKSVITDPKIKDIIIYSKQEFLNQLIIDKELQENHIILQGYEKYYDFLREIEDELNLTYSKVIP